MSNDADPATGVALRAANLGRLDARIIVPAYERASLAPGIVHIGVGGFHRAHQAAYLDELCSRGLTEWSITGAGVRPGDGVMAAALGAQDHLYSLVTRDAESTEVRVIGSIVDYVLAHESLDELVARLAHPGTRIVSLTITEGGYPVDEASGQFMAPAAGPLPRAFEAIVRASQLRRAAGSGGFTVLSCDNIIGNGSTARTATLGVAALIDEGLRAWIDENVAFPNGMVDRITPKTTDADRQFLSDEFGLVDRWPVVAEPFIQWIIEDEFPFGRPPWEDVGVLFTTDVEPFETLKLRILNAGHSVVAYLATLVGHVYVHDVLADPPFLEYLQRFLDDEVTPSLPPVKGIDVEGYKAMGAKRFANPNIRDQVARLAQDGSSKLPKFLLPTIVSQLERGGQVRLSALALAGWCQYLLGRDDQGADFDVAGDPRLSRASDFAKASVADPAAFLGFSEVFGDQLASDAVFSGAFVSALLSIRERGVYATIDRWLHDPTAT